MTLSKPNRYKTARCILTRDNQFLLARHGNEWTLRDKGWGLPGGQVEWREAPEDTARRELEEELSVAVHTLIEVGDYHYKRALHKVYCARFDGQITHFDTTELQAVAWFTVDEVRALEADRALHAGYERVAVEIAASLIDTGGSWQDTRPHVAAGR